MFAPVVASLPSTFPLRIGVGQVCEEQLHVPALAVESRSGGLSSREPLGGLSSRMKTERKPETRHKSEASRVQLRQLPRVPPACHLNKGEHPARDAAQHATLGA